MTVEDDRLARTVHCPKCGAHSPDPCRTPTGRTTLAHVARFGAAYRDFSAEGNNGGSYIRLQMVDEGMLHLEVGETCIRTIRQTISVSALACILTAAKDKGFQVVLDEYLAGDGGRGCPEIKIESDVSVERRNAGR